MSNRVITGIGSRNTPTNVLLAMEQIGAWCKKNKIYVRSGHADGADYAFEKGAQEYTLVYLPWNTFNSQLPILGKHIEFPSEDLRLLSFCKQIVNDCHPAADKLTNIHWKFMIRNVLQLSGYQQTHYSSAVVLYADVRDDIFGKEQVQGGSNLVFQFARKRGIPIFNFASVPADTPLYAMDTVESMVEYVTKWILMHLE